MCDRRLDRTRIVLTEPDVRVTPGMRASRVLREEHGSCIFQSSDRIGRGLPASTSLGALAVDHFVPGREARTVQPQRDDTANTATSAIAIHWLVGARRSRRIGGALARRTANDSVASASALVLAAAVPVVTLASARADHKHDHPADAAAPRAPSTHAAAARGQLYIISPRTAKRDESRKVRLRLTEMGVAPAGVANRRDRPHT